MSGSYHPLSQLGKDEIIEAASSIRREYLPDDEIVFKSITLLEPDKDAVLEYLEEEHAATVHRRSIDRLAFISFYRKQSV